MKPLLERPLFYIIISILASFFILVWMPIMYSIYVLAVLIVLLLIFGIWNKYRIIAKFCILPMVIGAVYFTVYSLLFYQPMLRFQDQTVELEGKITDECREGSNSKYYTVHPTKIIFKVNEYSTKEYRTHGNVVVYFPKSQTGYRVGTTIQTNGYVFDDDAEMLNSRVTQKNYLSIYASEQTFVSAPSSSDIHVITANIRSEIFSVYQKYFSAEIAEFFKALTLGDKDDLSSELYFDFRNAGVSHVLAVSGMHLSFLCAIIWAFLSLIRANLYLRSVIQLIIIWGFTSIVGFPSSCMRAAIMLTMYHMGVFINKESDPLMSLSVAVLLCCITNPYAIANIGLLLSASATFGILVLTPILFARIPELYHEKNILRLILNYIEKTVCMSIAATITTFPVLIISFKSIALISPLSNLLIILPIEILFGIAIASIVFWWAPPIYVVLSWMAQILYRYCEVVIEWIARMPVSSIYTGNIRFWIYFAVFIVFVGLFYFCLKKYKRFPIVSACLTVLLVLIGVQGVFDYCNRNTVSVYFVDVGQGNTTIVVSQDKAIIIDCGGDGDAYNSILSTLQSSGVRTVSAIYLTHMDSDHTKYVPLVMSHYKVEALNLPKRSEYSDHAKELIQKAETMTHLHYITKDETVSFYNKIIITSFTNHIDFSNDENENSIVYKLTYGNNRILCTGDVENDGETRLLDYQNKLECDIIEIAHHGSDGGSSEELLELTKAQLAIISVGENNKYNLPSLSAQIRIARYIPKMLRTDLEGTIQIAMSADSYQVKKGY